MFRHITAIFMLILMLSGCGLSSSVSDPVASFKSVLDQGLLRTKDARHVGLRPESSIHPAAWSKSRFEVIATEHDVQKTDSLVSPYLAKLEVTAQYYQSADFKTKTEADASTELNELGRPTKYVFDYAYQDGKWVLKSSSKYDETLDRWFDIKAGEQGGDMATFFTP